MALFPSIHLIQLVQMVHLLSVVLFALLATGAAPALLPGLLRGAPRECALIRFLELSLIAGALALLPLSNHLGTTRGIAMLAIYSSGAAILAWRRRRSGAWRPLLALSIAVTFCLNLAEGLLAIGGLQISAAARQGAEPATQAPPQLTALLLILAGTLALWRLARRQARH